MKNLQIIAIAMVTFILFAGCAESTSPEENPNIRVVGELITPHVNMVEMDNNNNNIQVNEVDSIRVVRVRVLMSRMMLFLENDNSTSGNVIKSEPFVYDLSVTGGLSILGNNSVPSGLYDKMKIEIHRFSANELSQYANDPIFKDFATSERNTILIEGITYNGENPSTFIFQSNTVANISLKFEPTLNLKNGSNTNIALQLDPNFFFKKWESILDPNNPENANDIANALINTIKAIKK